MVKKQIELDQTKLEEETALNEARIEAEREHLQALEELKLEFAEHWTSNVQHSTLHDQRLRLLLHTLCDTRNISRK